jgi:restriction system protein
MPAQFEDIVTKLISKFPDLKNVKKVGRSGDGGVDIRAVRKNKFGGHGVIIQVKRYAKNVQAQYVVNLIGAKTTEQCAEAVLITTSGFSQGAEEKAKLVQGVSLIGGMRLIELMVEHSVGLKKGKFGEFVRVTSPDGGDGTLVSLTDLTLDHISCMKLLLSS